MFCPNCRYEYNRGIYKCPDCGVDLVYTLPPVMQKPESELELVAIYTATDGSQIAFAKTILEEAGIEYMINDYPRSAHQAKFLVNSANAEVARALLADLK